MLVFLTLGMILACFAASSSYADSESPQPTPLPSSQPMPTISMTPLPQPVTMMRYEGITSQGQPVTIWVDQGSITSISIGIQTGTYSLYTATYHGHLADVQGSSFDVTLSNEKEWLHITGNLSVGTYGEPSQGTFHFIGNFSVSEYIPNTEVAGTWRLGRPVSRFVPTPSPTTKHNDDESPSPGTDEHTTNATDESEGNATVEDATPLSTMTSTPSPTLSPTPTNLPTSSPDATATHTATPTSTSTEQSTSTPTPTGTRTSTASGTPTPSGTPDSSSTATATPTPSGTPDSSSTATPTPTPTLSPTQISTSSSESTGASLSLGIQGEELAFDTDTLEITIAEGATMTFKFSNTSMTQEHSWVLLNHNNLREAESFVNAAMSAVDTGYIPTSNTTLMNTVIVYIEPKQPGTSKTITFNAPAPGEYLYICTVPGHFMAGDYGILTVKAP